MLVKDFRPISLTTIHKVTAKTLAERLKRIMPSIKLVKGEEE